MSELKEVTLEQRMICHMAFETCHQSKYEITIKGEGLLNDRKFYCETKTKKRKGEMGQFYGKSEVFFYFHDTPKGQEFKDIPSLLKSKGLVLKQTEKK